MAYPGGSCDLRQVRDYATKTFVNDELEKFERSFQKELSEMTAAIQATILQVGAFLLVLSTAYAFLG